MSKMELIKTILMGILTVELVVFTGMVIAGMLLTA